MEPTSRFDLSKNFRDFLNAAERLDVIDAPEAVIYGVKAIREDMSEIDIVDDILKMAHYCRHTAAGREKRSQLVELAECVYHYHAE